MAFLVPMVSSSQLDLCVTKNSNFFLIFFLLKNVFGNDVNIDSSPEVDSFSYVTYQDDQSPVQLGNVTSVTESTRMNGRKPFIPWEFDRDDKQDSSIFEYMPCSPTNSDLYAFELKKQNKIIRNLLIKGIPPLQNEKLMEMFKKLCKIIGTELNADDDIIGIDRCDSGSDQIIVKFKHFKGKMKVRKCAIAKDLWSHELIDLPPGVRNLKVHFRSQLTPFYENIQKMAKAARAKGALHSYQLCKDGFFVKRTQNSTGRMVLSKEQLQIYINSK